MITDGKHDSKRDGRDSIHLIDVLGLECHELPPDPTLMKRKQKKMCPQLLQDLMDHGVRHVSEAAYSRNAMGVDPFSYPNAMIVIDPRKPPEV